MLLFKIQKEHLVIKLDVEDKTTSRHCKGMHISLKDIEKIIHKVTGDDILNKEKTKKELEKQKHLKSFIIC